MGGLRTSRYEQILRDHDTPTRGLAGAIADAARHAREAAAPASPRDRMIADVAAGVIGPILSFFAAWVLGRARDTGVKRLYCVARDGQIISRVLSILAPAAGDSIDVRYLLGSRLAWNQPAIERVTHGEIFWAGDELPHFTARVFLSRFRVEPHECADALATLGITERDWDANLSRERRDAIKTLPTRDARLGELVLARSREVRPLVRDYLRRQGLEDAVPWALVDLGWAGSMQSAAARLLGRSDLRAYYFGLRKHASLARPIGQAEGYLFDHFRDQAEPPRAFPQVAGIMEMFCTADNGTVVGYERAGDEVRAVLREAHNTRALEWGLPVVHKTVADFAQRLAASGAIETGGEGGPAAIEALLSAFWLRPDREEARVWSAFPLEGGLGREDYVKRFVTPYRWHDLPRFFRHGGSPEAHRYTWHQANWLLTPHPLRTILGRASWLGRRRRSFNQPLDQPR